MILIDALPTMTDYLKPDNVIAIVAAGVTALSAYLMFHTFILQAKTVEMQQKMLVSDRKLKAKELRPLMSFSEVMDDYEPGMYHIVMNLKENEAKIDHIFLQRDKKLLRDVTRPKDVEDGETILPGTYKLLTYVLAKEIGREHIIGDFDLIKFSISYRDSIGSPYYLEAHNSTGNRNYRIKEKSLD